METTKRSLRHYERKLFKQHRFLGLSHGVVAFGPAMLVALSGWRLSLSYADVLMWVLPAIAYLASFLTLVVLMPKRDMLTAMARKAQSEAPAHAATRQITIDEA